MKRISKTRVAKGKNNPGKKAADASDRPAKSRAANAEPPVAKPSKQKKDEPTRALKVKPSASKPSNNAAVQRRRRELREIEAKLIGFLGGLSGVVMSRSTVLPEALGLRWIGLLLRINDAPVFTNDGFSITADAIQRARTLGALAKMLLDNRASPKSREPIAKSPRYPEFTVSYHMDRLDPEPYQPSLSLPDIPIARIDIVSPTSPDRTFFFALEGEATRGNEVLWGHDFFLLFDYGIVFSNGLAVVTGERLRQLLKEDVHATLGVEVVPVGFTLLERPKAPAQFQDGSLTNGPLRFRLRAPDKQNAPGGACGVNVVFTVDGAVIYSFFVEILLRDALSSVKRTTPVLDLDLYEVAKTTVSIPRKAKVFFIATNATWQVYGTIDEVEFTPRSTTLVNPANLHAAYADVLEDVKAIAANPIWRNLHDDLSGDPDDAEISRNAMMATAAAGWRLYDTLRADPVIRDVLAAIDALPDGSCVTVISNSAIFPWEILYPREYVIELGDQNYSPELLWGRRFIFESLVIAGTVSEKPPANRRQPSGLKIGMGLNSGIDQEAPWNTPGRPLLPVRLQKDFCDNELKTIGSHFDGVNEVFDTLRTAYEASLIYYFCHGATDELQFDKTSPSFKPVHVIGDQYPGWPVIFLNACEAGNISPLSFLSFRTKFRSKKAAGLIAPSFPVPTLFAALFGKAFMTQYVAGRAVGEILFDLRRELLQKDNPLGLWYSLQCLLDVRAPVR